MSITEYIFTEKYALVFGRYMEYNYKKMIQEFKGWKPENKEEEDKQPDYGFRFQNVKCIVIPRYSGSWEELESVHIDFWFSTRDDYFLKSILIWKKGMNINFKKIITSIYGCVGKKIQVCICDKTIMNVSFKKCEDCFIFNINREDVCCICLENGYRWIKLVCDCKEGRIIHRHCFQQLPANFDENNVWRKKCPCCRKSLSPWYNNNSKDIIEDPDFK